VVANKLGSLKGYRPLFVPSSIVGIGAMELADTADRSGVENTTMSPASLPRLLKRLKVSANRRLTDIQRISKLGNRYEPLLPDKLQHSSPSGNRRIGSGLGIHQISVEICHFWKVFHRPSVEINRKVKEKHSFFRKYVIFRTIFNREGSLFCLIRTI
jgi:hypothetical protein